MTRIKQGIIRLVRHVLSPRVRIKYGLSLPHRKKGYTHLSGRGLEIGALHIPAALGHLCHVTYADIIFTEEASLLFPEVNPSDLVDVTIIVDLDKAGLSNIPGGTYDFVILNHVIEHVANPIKVVDELFRIVAPGGLVVISAPDKDFTFDKSRALTFIRASGGRISRRRNRGYG